MGVDSLEIDRRDGGPPDCSPALGDSPLDCGAQFGCGITGDTLGATCEWPVRVYPDRG
ncbi:MAG: hypothetical protein LAE24_01170 [Candidatus Contendobacter sp.]|nr:hypothetical protein [Candidatus Contendobacter sp.]